MNKVPRRDKVHLMRRPNVNNYNKPGTSLQNNSWISCFNLTGDSFWAQFLRSLCAVDEPSNPKQNNKHSFSQFSKQRSFSSPDLKYDPPSYKKKEFKEISFKNTKVPVGHDLVSESIFPTNFFSTLDSGEKVSLPFTGTQSYRKKIKRSYIISLMGWQERRRDYRNRIGNLLYKAGLYNEGKMFTTLEIDAIWNLGDYDSVYPVLHASLVTEENQLKNTRSLTKKIINQEFDILIGSFEEFAHLNLYPTQNNEFHATELQPENCKKCVLILAYKSLDTSTDSKLLTGWLKWTGAWPAYSLLQEKGIAVTSITLYVRESPGPKESFKYMVFIETLVNGKDDLQQLLAATQRLRVERWSGYTCLYASVSLDQFINLYKNNPTDLNDEE